LLRDAPLFKPSNFNPLQPDAAPGWRNSNHFANCPNFEQSLLKKVTRRKRWSTDKGSGWPQGEVWWSKSREEPWRAQAASPRQSRSNPNFRGNRVDTIFEQGLRPALFFIAFSSDVDTGSSEGSASNKNARKRHHGVTHLIQRSIELAAGI
jgi:hypothetical protein